MTDHELTDLDYSFHIDDEAALDEPWMYDQEIMAQLEEIDRLYEGVDQLLTTIFIMNGITTCITGWVVGVSPNTKTNHSVTLMTSSQN